MYRGPGKSILKYLKLAVGTGRARPEVILISIERLENCCRGSVRMKFFARGKGFRGVGGAAKYSFGEDFNLYESFIAEHFCTL